MRFVGSVGILLLGCVFACAQPVQTVRIRVYDYTAIEPQTFDIAKAEAGKRLGEAAIAVQWIDCRFHARPLRNDACDQPFTPADFIVNILPWRMAVRFAQPKNALAFAGISRQPGADRQCWVFYDAIRAVGQHQALIGTLVGDVVAHELAHLLLGSVEHTESGVMRNTWSEELLRDAGRGQLRFSSEVLAGMRDGLARRWLRSGSQAPVDQHLGGK